MALPGNRLTHLRGESGQGMAEYSVIVIVVVVSVILALRYFGDSISGNFQNATEEIKALTPSEAALLSPGVREEREPSPSAVASAIPSDDTLRRDLTPSGTSAQLDALRPSGVGDPDPAVSRELQLQFNLPIVIGILFSVLGVALVFIGKQLRTGKKKKKGRKKVLIRSEKEEGQAIVEFTLIAITFLFVILGVMQLALALNAYAMVRYAAYNAARAAIVHGGDFDKMKDAARLSLVAIFPTHGRADHARGFTENYLAAAATDWMFELGEGPITEVKIVNAPADGEKIGFDNAPDAARANITVQVTHRYQLVIPLVNRIMYTVYKRFTSGEGSSGETIDSLARKTDQMRRFGGELSDREFRIPLVAHYTMRLQSDYQSGGGA